MTKSHSVIHTISLKAITNIKIMKNIMMNIRVTAIYRQYLSFHACLKVNMKVSEQFEPTDETSVVEVVNSSS